MQLALRRAYGYAYNPFRGMRGLGATCGDGTADGEAACFGVVTSNDPVPTVTVPNPGSLLCPDGSPPFSDGTCTETPASTGVNPIQVTDSSGVVWTCDSSGRCMDPYGNAQIGPPTTNNPIQAAAAAQVAARAGSGYGAASAATQAAQLAAAVSNAVARAIAPTSGTICPPGYIYGTPGQSVTVAPGAATVGTGKCLPVSGGVGTGQLISGVSNTSLGLIALAVFALMMMGSKR